MDERVFIFANTPWKFIFLLLISFLCALFRLEWIFHLFSHCLSGSYTEDEILLSIWIFNDDAIEFKKPLPLFFFQCFRAEQNLSYLLYDGHQLRVMWKIFSSCFKGIYLHRIQGRHRHKHRDIKYSYEKNSSSWQHSHDSIRPLYVI